MRKFKKQAINKGKHLLEPKIDTSTPDEQQPIFSFRFLQDNVGVNTCNGDQILAFVVKLHLISQLTWGNWKLSPHTGIGYEKIARSSINTAIPNAITEDVEHFLSFRFHHGRCVGYRDGIVFYIVWIDGSFKLYDH